MTICMRCRRFLLDGEYYRFWRARRLRETEARYRTLVEQLPLHIYIDALDAHHSTIYASPQIERMLGYSAEEWLADADLFSKILHPEDRPHVLERLERLAEHGEQ